ncbi:alpha/beta hydrolase [Sphingopyxis sp.]|uniref:alpha/beta hydrolase n=1 Tax=Sphingopyxis sp. TaxID=1908224 RepID=UPI00263820D3|nr:alpha/beta hydrolase [Sphingopyxis sp.]MCW0199466.1 alpha/beta hydrolase [Sphingopyxis sp.]
MTATTKFLLAGALAACAVIGAGAAAQQRGFARAGAGAWADDAPMKHVPPPAGTRIERDIAYGGDPAQRLDVYRPAKADRAPMIVMVHGGGWWRGDKARPPVIDNKVNHWLPKGYIMVSVNYRMVPNANPLVQAGDVAAALAYIQGHAAKWGGDPARVVLMGHSAGAHLVSLLAAAPEIARDAGARPWLGTIALDSAAYDVVAIMERRHFDLYDRAFGTDRALWSAASPALRLKVAPAPMLLVCSSKRADACPPAEAFAKQAQALGARVTTFPVDMTHGEINALLGTGGAYTDAADAFLRSIGLN